MNIHDPTKYIHINLVSSKYVSTKITAIDIIIFYTSIIMKWIMTIGITCCIFYIGILFLIKLDLGELALVSFASFGYMMVPVCQLVYLLFEEIYDDE